MKESLIEKTRVEMAKRIAEAQELEVKAKELTATDVDAGIAADLKASATRKAIGRLRELLTSQVQELLEETKAAWKAEDKKIEDAKNVELDRLAASFPSALAVARADFKKVQALHPWLSGLQCTMDTFSTEVLRARAANYDPPGSLREKLLEKERRDREVQRITELAEIGMEEK